MNIDTTLTLTFIFLPLCFSSICLYYAFYFLRVARQMEDIPTSKIRSAAQGFVELSGTVKPILEETTVAQLSKESVAWSRFQVEQLLSHQTDNGQQYYWSTIAEGASDTPFMLQDSTGVCLVLPNKAEIIPSETLIWYGSSPNGVMPPKTFWAWFFASSSGRFRYKEQRLQYNKVIHARGMFSTLGQNPSILQNYSLLDRNIPLLSGLNLPNGYHYVISAVPSKRLSRNYKLKALVFFIGFLIFSAIILNSTYPVVKKILFSN